MTADLAGTVIGLAVALLLAVALVWLIVSGLTDSLRHHQNVARIRAESRRVLATYRSRR